MRKTAMLAGLAALTGVAIAGVPGAGAGHGSGDGERPRAVQVRSDRGAVLASQGSWCYAGGRHGMCADYAYPLRVEERLAVEPGEEITLKMHDRSIKRLSVELLRVRGERPEGIQERGALQDVHRNPRNRRAWRATVPAEATDANRISISAVYKRRRGDSNWWAGIRLTSRAMPVPHN